MSASAAVASTFLRVQKASEANGTVMNGSTSLIFVPERQLAKPKFMQDLSRIKPQMMQKVFSSIGLSEEKKADFAPFGRQAEDFNGQPEAFIHTEMLELFPMSTVSSLGRNPRITENKIALPFDIHQTDLDSSKYVPAKAPEQRSTAQLTIFYDGAMNVYDMSAEKAQAIMRLASANSSRNTRTSPISSSKTEQISEPLPSRPVSNAMNENQPQTPRVGLEIVRKLSLQNFLLKRKERFNSVAPYTTMKQSKLPSKVEKESDDRIILSLASSITKF